jgi:hypothetical protein
LYIYFSNAHLSKVINIRLFADINKIGIKLIDGSNYFYLNQFPIALIKELKTLVWNHCCPYR